MTAARAPDRGTAGDGYGILTVEVQLATEREDDLPAAGDRALLYGASTLASVVHVSPLTPT